MRACVRVCVCVYLIECTHGTVHSSEAIVRKHTSSTNIFCFLSSKSIPTIFGIFLNTHFKYISFFCFYFFHVHFMVAHSLGRTLNFVPHKNVLYRLGQYPTPAPRQCVDKNHDVLRVDFNHNDCMNNSYEWRNKPVHFDNVIEAYVSLLEVATFKGWISLIQGE